jgi:hypothetical protein
MADLFMDGFDYYATEHIGLKWREASDYSIIPDEGRNGGGCLYPTDYGTAETPFIDGSSGVTVGFAIKRASGNSMYVALRNNDGTDLAFFQIETNGSATIGGLTTHAFVCNITTNHWRYVELSAINTSGTITGALKVFNNTVEVFSQSYSIDTETSLAIESARLAAGGAGAFRLDDFYIEAGIVSHGDVQVQAYEPDGTVTSSIWVPSNGTSALHDCVNSLDTAEGLYISALCTDEASPNTIEFSSSDIPSPLPTVFGTQVNAWMSVDEDAILYGPNFLIGSADFAFWEPTSPTMEGISIGKTSVNPDNFGYQRNE